MAVATMRVPTIFTAVDRFSDVVSRMGAGVNRFGKNTTSALSRVDHKLNGVFNSMNGLSQLAIGGGVGGLFYYAGKDIMEFEKAIASVAAITGTKIGAMNSQIISLGKETKRSVIDVAKGFEIVGSKMSEYLDNPEALKTITGAGILLAKAANLELEPAINSMTGVMNIFKQSAEDAYKIVNKLSAGETVGSITIAQTADILPQFGAQAVRANVTIEESIALVQALTKSLGVENVGRGLRNILFDISSTKTWDKNRWKAVKMAGIDFEFVTNNANKLVDRLRELKKLQGVKGGVELFFKRVNSIAANTLFQNFDKGDASFTAFLEKIKNLNDAEEKAAKNTSTLSYAIQTLKASFTNYVVENDNANGALGVTKSLMAWLSDNIRNVVNLVLSLTIAFVGWKVIIGIVSLASGIVSIFNSIMKANLIITQIATFRAIAYSEALWLVVAAQWAAYWPVLLVIAALGGLAYAFWDSGEAAENSATKQIDALMEQNKAYMGSTNVLSTELQKQEALLNKHNAKVLTPKKSILFDVPKSEAQLKAERILRNEKERAAVDAYNKNVQRIAAEKLRAKNELNNLKDSKYNNGYYTMNQSNFMQEQLNKDKNLMFLQSKGMSFDEIEKIYPNLTTVAERKQQLEIIIKDPGQVVKETKFEGTTYGPGIPVMVGSTKTPKK